MKKIKLITAFAVTMLAVLPLGLKAEKLSQWQFEKTVVGEKPTKNYLTGKVVVLEYWGVR